MSSSSSEWKNPPKIFFPLDGEAVSLGAFLGAVFVVVSFS
jgi:hypothetical protein